MSFSREIKTDKRYKKLLHILEVAQSRIDVARDRNEAFAMHSGLLVRQLYGKQVFSTKKVLLATAQLQANRSRLVEIRSRASEHISYLHQGCTAFRRYCLANYDFTGYKTKEQKDSLLDRPMRPILDFIAEVDNLIEMLDTFIKDIDQAGHGVRHIVEIHKLLDSSKVGRS